MVFAEAIGANGDCLRFKTHIILEKDDHGHRVLQAMQMDSKDQGTLTSDGRASPVLG